MIYEFRTYTLHPGTLPEFLKRFGDALPKRERFSKLAAFWYTEIGPLNEVIHVWPYEDEQQRAKIRAESVKDGSWPPKTGDFIIWMKSEIFNLLPFSPLPTPSNNGPFFEMRTSVLKAFTIPDLADRWKGHLPLRTKLSPLAGVFTSDLGELNQWIHIWPYKSLDERTAVRNKAAEIGTWPPLENNALRQESKILLAAPFSPMK
jgi:hypothetical protein